ncbi:ester cyclase [Streptomyces sp. J2-1]|uniref:ester cyclase family protein n=1 Tax=Streptomyces corallincola TaxID=2851888 RepID=UPI001C392F03|nr:ester cyclase family protein [Streptomyces corallincola]MBV2357559.1 ester cyclase [Streptomyces corallincola]
MTSKDAVRNFWAGYEQGDLDATWERYVAADLVIHPSSGYTFTRETWLEAEKALLAAFADLRVEILDQVAEGDRVATRWAVTGRQTGEFFGVPSAGNTARLTGTTVDVVRDGRIAEHWAEVGVPNFLQQLAAPAEAAGPSGGTAGDLVDDADHVRLERLATEVNWRVDNGVAETVSALFTEDGTLHTFGEPSVGTAAIDEWGRMMDRDKPLGSLRHVLTNFRFTHTGPGTAEGTYHVTAYIAGNPQGDDTVPYTMGVGTDQYLRTDDDWKVVSRSFTPHVLRAGV